MTKIFATKEKYLAGFSPVKAGLCGKCPQCQQGKIFKSPLKIKEKCEVCGLDYSFAGPADGPSFFAMTFMCFFAMVWTLVLRFAFDAPIWVLIVTILPLTILGSAVLLHLLRGWFVCAEYYIKVRDGRLDYPGNK